MLPGIAGVAGFNAGSVAPAADNVLRSPNNMTSNTLPSPFVASASTEYDSNSRAWKAFDGSTADYPTGSYYSTGGLNAAWVQIQLDAARWLASYKITNRGNVTDASPKDWTLQGSNNGSTWTTVDTQTGINWASTSLEKTFTIASGSRGSYSYWKLDVTAVQVAASGVGISEIKYYT